MRTDVVVIGAGVTGLVAAYRLAQAGRRVVVLEARHRVGGRLWTDVRDGVLLELGGQWVSPDQTALLALVDELGLDLFSRYRDGQAVYVGPDGDRRTFSGVDFPVAASTTAEVDRLSAELDELSVAMDADTPWTLPDAEGLDAQTFAAWLAERSDDAEARELVGLFIGAAMLGKPTFAFSALQAVQMAASAGRFAHLIDDGFILDRRVVGGLQGVPLALAERVRGLGVDVRLGCPVVGVDWSAESAVVEAGDERFEADRVVVAVPPTLVRRIGFSPPLPPLHQQWRQHQSFGQVLKMHATYATPFWRGAGLSGTGFGLEQLVHEAYDNTNHGSEQGTLVGFVSDRRADEILHLPPAERRRRVLESFAAYFGDQALTPVSYEESDWFCDEWTGGAYATSFDVGGLVRYGPVVHEAIGPMVFGSSDVAGPGFQHVDGAVRVGERLAVEVAGQTSAE